MNIPELVSSLTFLANKLGNLVAKENGILKARRAGEIAALRDEKERLTSAYENQFAELKRQPGALSEIAPDAIARLRAATSQFQVHLDEHRHLIQAAKSVTERMLETIARDAIGPSESPPIYDRAAATRSVFGASTRALPLALNQVV